MVEDVHWGEFFSLGLAKTTEADLYNECPSFPFLLYFCQLTCAVQEWHNLSPALPESGRAIFSVLTQGHCAGGPQGTQACPLGTQGMWVNGE